jgi:hypothetical protein
MNDTHFADEATLAHIARLERENAELRRACEVFSEWLRREDAGPQYPEGTTRDHPGNEAIWREWWDGNLAICQEAQDLARAALSKAGAK